MSSLMFEKSNFDYDGTSDVDGGFIASNDSDGLFLDDEAFAKPVKPSSADDWNTLGTDTNPYLNVWDDPQSLFDDLEA